MIEAVVPESAEQRLETLPETLEVLGSWHEPLGDHLVLLRVLVRSDRTEPVLAELESRFSGYTDFRIVILEVEATLPRPDPPRRNGSDTSPPRRCGRMSAPATRRRCRSSRSGRGPAASTPSTARRRTG